MTRITGWVHGAFGALAIALGVLVLVKPSLALSPDAYSPLTSHLTREQGAEGVFVGLIALWSAFTPAVRRPVHIALLVFAALFALIHWGEYAAGRRELTSPLVNSVPFLVLLLSSYGQSDTT